ncbi:MAG: dipeptide ABC transporter ATP-binding protein [Anaerolineae bacterium]|nr:dipeptide ABC transporter ATP-binding protein [Anaerolineae bacterium]
MAEVKTIKQTNDDLVVVENLVKYFPVRSGLLQRVTANVKAVDGVSFTIKRGETLGLVGESGCGKTTVGRTLLRLIPQTDGHVYFEGQDVFSMRRQEMKEIRKEMQIIFQDPFSSLDPRMPVGESIMEGLVVHRVGTPQERWERVINLLRMVNMEDFHAKRFPHEFSGGQRQRIGIARALALDPKFIVADEPVSALDVSVQAQVLNILMDLQEQLGLTYLFVAHNLSVVEHISTRVAVMYLGKMAELASRDEIFEHPLHPYTQALMSAIPIADPRKAGSRDRIILEGDVPSPINPPAGCHFHPRCEHAIKGTCDVEEPVFKDYGDGHIVACWLVEKNAG